MFHSEKPRHRRRDRSVRLRHQDPALAWHGAAQRRRERHEARRELREALDLSD